MSEESPNRAPDTEADIDLLNPTEDAGPPTSSAAEAPPDELAEARRERDEYYNRLLRQAAEFDNYRKRIDRERREQTDTATSDLLAALLPIVDDFERALAADATVGEAYRQGVQIIHKQLEELLRRWGVRPIEAVGTDFDPHIHQAVVQEASPDHRDGEVLEELRRGYMLGGRLLRPAMVKVAKA